MLDSSKFEKEFNFKPTSYDEGINAIVERDYSKTEKNKRNTCMSVLNIMHLCL